MKYTVASFFAGIGGICYGFKQAGAEVIYANDFDKNACITYRYNFGNVHLVEGDIRAIEVSTVPDVDIINGGFPCQAFSIAGYRQGFNDEKGRGNLFFELARIIEAKKPKAIFLENVKNLEGHDHGNTFNVIINTLEDLGYHIHHKVLNTMEYGDIPQNRERIYIVGFLSKEHSDNFCFPSKITLTKTIHHVANPHIKMDDKYYYTKGKIYDTIKDSMTNRDTLYQWRRIYCRENKKNVCPTLTANMGTGGHNVPLLLDDFGIRKLTPEECVGFQGFPEEFRFPDTISNASKYKQAGNSVSVTVIKRIADNIIKSLDGISCYEADYYEQLKLI